mmetsp:Transcript_53914/g.128138  ORF Transcript_53914/g.128138 Transcript_53914/m.128138 type:complete len:207 (-) Transcript_53914:3223-3843(-)
MPQDCARGIQAAGPRGSAGHQRGDLSGGEGEPRGLVLFGSDGEHAAWGLQEGARVCHADDRDHANSAPGQVAGWLDRPAVRLRFQGQEVAGTVRGGGGAEPQGRGRAAGALGLLRAAPRRRPCHRLDERGAHQEPVVHARRDGEGASPLRHCRLGPGDRDGEAGAGARPQQHRRAHPHRRPPPRPRLQLPRSLLPHRGALRGAEGK